jgi:hypothetical protein
MEFKLKWSIYPIIQIPDITGKYEIIHEIRGISQKTRGISAEVSMGFPEWGQEFYRKSWPVSAAADTWASSRCPSGDGLLVDGERLQMVLGEECCL